MDVALGNTLLLMLPYGEIISMDQPRLQYGAGNASGPRRWTYLGSLQSNPPDFVRLLRSHLHPILPLPLLPLASGQGMYRGPEWPYICIVRMFWLVIGLKNI
jgi:hypothetical protein